MRRTAPLCVPKKGQPELFEKFFRGSNAKTVRPNGTGIGLFLVQKVIKEHGEEVIFHSVQGEGSTFAFRLPLDGDAANIGIS